MIKQDAPLISVTSSELPDVKLVTYSKFEDHRGYFCQPFNKKTFEAYQIKFNIVQENYSLSSSIGTVRGLHFQIPPFSQAKLISVIEGSIFDVAVDIRPWSTTFGQYMYKILHAHEGMLLYIPEGFAHGFCTLEKNTRIMYKVSNYYSPMHERGIHWRDKSLSIPWPIEESLAILSEKDGNYLTFQEMAQCFTGFKK